MTRKIVPHVGFPSPTISSTEAGPARCARGLHDQVTSPSPAVRPAPAEARARRPAVRTLLGTPPLSAAGRGTTAGRAGPVSESD
jgi:hypothetical protein